jgi:hypothetical protein
LFAAGKLPFPQASRWAGLSRTQLEEELLQRNLTLVRITEECLENEAILANWEIASAGGRQQFSQHAIEELAMRYSLGTLIISAAIVPPILAGLFWIVGPGMSLCVGCWSLVYLFIFLLSGSRQAEADSSKALANFNRSED